jgi:hypothetical protein
MPHTTAVVPGKGTLLKATIATVLTTIAQRVSLDGPELTVGKAETTHLDSSAKTKRPTISDSGAISGTLWYDPQDPTHKFLFGLYTTPALVVFNLVYPDADGTVDAFTGFLTKLKGTGMEVEGNLEAEFEIEISGLVTRTP